MCVRACVRACMRVCVCVCVCVCAVSDRILKISTPILGWRGKKKKKKRETQPHQLYIYLVAIPLHTQRRAESKRECFLELKGSAVSSLHLFFYFFYFF